MQASLADQRNQGLARSRLIKQRLTLAAWLVLDILALYLIIVLYAQNQQVFALLALVLVSIANYIFWRAKNIAYRYIFPAIAGMLIFIIFPMIYTIGVGFTNFSAANMLKKEQATQFFLNQRFVAGERYAFSLHDIGGGEFQVQIDLEEEGGLQLSEPISDLTSLDERTVFSLEPAIVPLVDPLPIREIINLRSNLNFVDLRSEENEIRVRFFGLREFADVEPRYLLAEDGSLFNQQTGQTLVANDELGFFVDQESLQPVTPGYRVFIGWDNYLKVLTDKRIRDPFLQIFAWTVSFAFLSVVFTLIVGLLLANLLQWDQIKGKAVYRTLLILPYAVPAFISILVFKGLFNQNFGEINMILNGLFGIQPNWMTDPALARTMILIVNTWLGYPYILLLCMGLLQSINTDLYEATAMDGAGPLANLWHITLPSIIKPLTPLLIASFAFNFNNFVLIALLTNGQPDILGATTPAGTTDLLVSYTYRIAFQDTGQNYALGAAIASFIFIVVAGLALLNLKLTKVKV